MRKLKLYLDTSTISHLFADDVPDKMADTNKLWDDFVSGKYEICISHVVVDEIEQCSAKKRNKLIEKMRLIDFEVLPETDTVKELAGEYIKGGVLKEKSIDDCFHIAYAVVYNCDVIVSWNFKHLVNFRTINKVKIVNAMNRYGEIGIVSPTMLVEEED